ncbi:MAG: DUF262 domain-containing protein [Alphaproteobacteria bacterium]|nr:MAG: DUF262 domain-containing protein [Alphaproteobacteria bacterium]
MKLHAWEPDLRSLVDRIDRGDIDLQPDFQRQEVWSLAKKRKLIDTILRDWSIPPVHLVLTRDNKLEVLDGQQRLASIRDYFNNVFSISGRITPEDSIIQSLHGKFYKRLDDVTRRKIDQYTLRCFRITEYRPEEPSELFYRLNQPAMLTAGEQRNALYGPARSQLKELVDLFGDLGNSKEALGFSNLRLAYDDILARILFFLEEETFAIKGTEARISERFRTQEGFSDGVIRRAVRSIELFSKARSKAVGARFNKASLLSWLLFFARFSDADSGEGAIEAFMKARGGLSSAYAAEAVSVFNDRASLRVTDVSSVVYRDFCLWYVYYFSVSYDLPPSMPAEPLLLTKNVLDDRDDVTFEYVLSKNLDIERWGQLL